MTKKILILAVLTLFSVNMLGVNSGKHSDDYQKYAAYLNYQEFFEDFSVDNGEWTKYDPEELNKIELDYTNDHRLEFNDWKRYEPGYVYRPFPATDFVLEYDINITDHGGNGRIIGPGFSDTLGSLTETQNGIFGVFYAGWPGGGGVPHLDLCIFENGMQILDWTIFLDFLISTNRTYYVRLEKFEDQVTISIFSDAARTSHISGSPKTFTTNLVHTTFNYFYAVNGYHTSPHANWEWTSGWVDNIYVRTEQSVLKCLIDIKPLSCPNPVNIKSKGVLTAAVLGTGDFDVSTINPASIQLEGIAPVRSKVKDVSTPVWNPQYDCECNTIGKDGFDDLVLKFDTREIAVVLGEVTDGEVLELTLTGQLTDGTPLEGKDCIIVINKEGKKLAVPVDIKPKDCPNRLNVRKRGVLTAAIQGTSDFDVARIEISSLRLKGVTPIGSTFRDVATPFEPFIGKTSKDHCNTIGPDGFMDLVLKFNARKVVRALGKVKHKDIVVLKLRGRLREEFGGTPIKGEDVVVIIKRKKK